MTHDRAPKVILRRVTTPELTDAEVDAARAILWAAFETVDGGMTEDDWDHALGGVHVLAELDGRIVAHASVVDRDIRLDGHPLRTGYVEAVAVDPSLQRGGVGTLIMREVAAILESTFELGALATGTPEFYERLGWLRWRGPTSVRTASGEQRTPEDDGWILVLETSLAPRPVDLDGTISCEWRPGDVW